MRRLLHLFLAAAALAWGTPAYAGSSVILPGHVPSRLRAAVALERAPGDEKVDLSLVLRLDSALLEQTLTQIYGPGAPAKKHFLSSAEFAQKFGLAGKRQALARFAQAAGLTVAPDARPGSLVVRVSGPASRVERAFGVLLRHYRGPDGQVFRSNDGEPSIPASLAPHLGAVLGLSNFRGAMRPHLRRRHLGTAIAGKTARISPRQLTGGGYQGSLTPSDIKTIYSLSQTLNGSGQTIAVYELDSYAASDITLYEDSLFPSPHPAATVTCTSQDGACFECGADQDQTCDAATLGDGGANGDGGMTECALDIELAIAMAPSANILVYTAMNTNADSLAAYADIASDDLARSVSTSWGEDEQDLGAAAMNSENTIFQQMAAQGQAIFSASGDAGAYDASGVSGDSAQEEGTLLTDDPASQPYVTGVGGTNLSGAIGSSLTETVWNEGCEANDDPGDNCSFNGAGGGGVADYAGDWPIPAYQSGVATAYSSRSRNVPDVALYADPDSAGYNICVGGSCANCGGSDCTTIIGGTSATAPLWAGLWSLVGQERAQSGASSLGFANPTLYELATGSLYQSAFNDITSGDNGFYSAGPGYDEASGWGSFHGDALIGSFSPAHPPTSLDVVHVWVSSMSLQWGADGNPVGTQYAVQYWQAYGSTITFVTPSTNPVLGNLAEGATYFVTVGALNGLGEFTPSGLVVSTVTIAQPSLTANVLPAGGTVSIHPPPGLISLQIPAGAVSQPVAVTLTIPAGFPMAPSPGANLTGTGFGVQITPTPAVEPLTNTLLSFSYQAFRVAGLDPSEFSIARYDPNENVWVPLPSTANTADTTVTALTSHWSLFQLMTAAPAPALSAPKVFPNPFRPALGETNITFSDLPANTTLRVYDILGEKVKELSANASGLASWDGRNDHGSNVASGVYFVLAGAASGRKTFKVAIQR